MHLRPSSVEERGKVGFAGMNASASPAIVVVDADLSARARVETAAGRHGLEVVTSTGARLGATLERTSAVAVVVDLDQGGTDALAAVEEARRADLLPARVVGFFSHVDADLGRAARAAGIEALPRGRFWSGLEELLEGIGA
jgi:ActR/RegA family two-component response regulator